MKFKNWIALIVLGLAAVVNANVSGDMFQMQRHMGSLLRADSIEAFQNGANAFLEAAKKAQQTMPSSLDDDQEKFQSYQKAMQEVIDTVNYANELAIQGKLEEAKATAAKLNQLKKVYHAEYK